MNDTEKYLHKSFKTLLYIFGEADQGIKISTSKNKLN